MKWPRTPNGNTDWGQWGREVLDCIKCLKVESSPTVQATTTTRGTFLDAKSAGGAGGSTPLQFKGQWEASTSSARS
jgi:hypothetical protein